MKTEIINNGTTEFPFYKIMVNGEEYCSTGNIKKAEQIVKLLSIHDVMRRFGNEMTHCANVYHNKIYNEFRDKPIGGKIAAINAKKHYLNGMNQIIESLNGA